MIEPQPYNCEKILTNSVINGFSKILIVAAAAGAADGFVVLHSQRGRDRSRLAMVGNGVNDMNSQFEVPVVRLDSIAMRHSVGNIRLLKIDVEGYERHALAGAGDTLSATDNLVFECLSETEGSEIQWIAQELTGHGFVLRQVDGSTWTPGSASIENNVWATRTEPND